jgi:hypothetical protein
MVNLPLPRTVATSWPCTKIANSSRDRTTSGTPETLQKPAERAFVQILGKLYFFQLLENLRRILIDYAQKPTGRANPAFKAPC